MRGSSEERLAGESNEAERIQAQEPGPQVPLLVGADPLPRVPTGSSSFSPQRHFHEDGAGEELTESIGSRESLELAVIGDQQELVSEVGRRRVRGEAHTRSRSAIGDGAPTGLSTPGTART
jgi:hypothetical protein